MQPDPGPHRPAPILTDDNAFYWEGAAAGRLLAQRCGECAIVRHPPRPMCPHCHSLAVDVIRLSGRGTLYSYAILHHPQSPVFDYPVRAALVDLEEGIRVLAELTEIATDDITHRYAFAGELRPHSRRSRGAGVLTVVRFSGR